MAVDWYHRVGKYSLIHMKDIRHKFWIDSIRSWTRKTWPLRRADPVYYCFCGASSWSAYPTDLRVSECEPGTRTAQLFVVRQTMEP